LSNEVARTGYHFAKPSIHFVLVLASSHSVQLAQLLDEFVHGEHGAGESFTFLIYVFGAINDFAV
jgi:hypothetical protein